MNRAPISMLTRAMILLPGALSSASAGEDLAWDTTLDVGTRSFDLEWRTAAAPTGNGANPPATGSWDGITTAEATVGLGLHYGTLHLRGEGIYGRIIAGDSSVSVFSDDSRTQTTDRSEQSSDEGDVREGTVALGVSVGNAADTLRLMCEFGFTHSEQRLTLSDGVQVVPATGAYAGLDSHYEARWQGPWIGLSGSWEVVRSWVLLAGCRGQMVEYRGVMDFNLRSDLAHPRSIEQAGSGFALAVGAGIVHRLTSSTDIRVLLTREQWRVTDGDDRVNYSNGTSDDVPLLDVTLSVWILRCGLRWEY